MIQEFEERDLVVRLAASGKAAEDNRGTGGTPPRFTDFWNLNPSRPPRVCGSPSPGDPGTLSWPMWW